MVTIFFIIAFIFCTAITAAAVLVSYRLLTSYSNQFLRSFFYYLIGFYAFTYYSLWAQVLVMFGLSRVTIDNKELNEIVNFIPLLGIPFLFISWIMLTKMSSQLSNEQIKTWKELKIHGIIISAGIFVMLLGYLLVPEIIFSTTSKVPMSPLSFLLLVETIYILTYTARALRVKETKRYMINFNLLMLAGLLSRIGLFVLTVYFEVLLPFTITSYFLTNLVPLVYLWRVSDDIFDPIHSELSEHSAIDQIANQFNITRREKEIIEQVALGKTNQQIAEELFISLQTVKDHTHRIYRKTGVNSRMKLIRLLSK